jgi:hypothetical protein
MKKDIREARDMPAQNSMQKSSNERQTSHVILKTDTSSDRGESAKIFYFPENAGQKQRLKT